MEKKAIALKNLGMNRDLSISKLGETNAYENYNIRILARDKDTLLSVTNERGNCEIPFSDTGESAILGDYLLGWNVLNEHLILFLTDAAGTNDYMYRVDFDSQTPKLVMLFPINGNTSLGFSPTAPIESVVYYESETVKKIYWVDGIHPLRMMNFVADATEMAKWDSTYFDANRELRFGATVSISKDNSGNARPNGVIQYLLTYYNKHSQETGYAWMSDIVYLSPENRGGAADENNNNKVTLEISKLDTRFTNYRIYSIFRSSYDGTTTAYVVGEGEVPEVDTEKVYVVDDAANQTAVDASELLFLGSQSVNPYTMAHKDDTLFLGGLEREVENYDELEAAIATYMRTGSDCNPGIITFKYSSDDDSIPYVEEVGLYPYKNQLSGSSSEITTFKGNEKYRFALSFRTKNGKQTEAFWIGDATNTLYPIIDVANKKIKRVVVECDIPPQVIAAIQNNNLDAHVVQLMIAEATYADRSVKAQGVITPTMFNVWSRYNDRLYAIPSWSTRPRNSVIANRHFDVVNNASQSTGEIECNFWNTSEKPKPYYTWVDYNDIPNKKYGYEYEGLSNVDYAMLVIGFRKAHISSGIYQHIASLYYIRVSDNASSATAIKDITFTSNHEGLFVEGGSSQKHVVNGSDDYTIYVDSVAADVLRSNNWKSRLYVALKEKAVDMLKMPADSFIPQSRFEALCDSKGYVNVYIDLFANFTNLDSTPFAAADDYNGYGGGKPARWRTNVESGKSLTVGYTPSYSTQHLMFVDENVVTLNSPELFYEAVSLDKVENYKLRIVGIAKVSSCTSDYVVDASHAKLTGTNLASVSFSGEKRNGNVNGLQSWPLWSEIGLVPREEKDGYERPDSIYDYTPADYTKTSGNIVKYWLYTFGKSGAIDGFVDSDGSSDGVMRNKVFGNLRFSYETIYNNAHDGSGNRINDWEKDLVSIRYFNSVSSQIMTVDIGKHGQTPLSKVNYDASIDELLSMPGPLKYPIRFTAGAVDAESTVESDSKFLYTNTPVPMRYDSSPHVVMSLDSELVTEPGTNLDMYQQTILPVLSGETDVTIPSRSLDDHITGALLPWIDNVESANQGHTVDPGVGTPIVVNLTLPSDKFEIFYFSGPGTNAYLWLDKSNIASSAMIASWNACVQQFVSNRIYVRLQVTTSDPAYADYDDKVFLVDISNFYLTGTDMVTIPGGNVAGIDSLGSSTVKLNVDLWTYNSLNTPPLAETGYSSFAIGDGTVSSADNSYQYLDYKIDSTSRIFNITPDEANGASHVNGTDEYVFVGEIYYPYGEGGIPDTRYGDVKNNRFIVAGPEYSISTMSATTGDHNPIVGNQGDTYFQRWDDLRIKPHSEEDVNGVVDIVSTILETHINIDGRTDNNRETKYIASMNNAQFDDINKVYSQPNDFVTRRDLDADFNQSVYPSHITWTLQKAPMAETDEWMHITLANTLGLDGDKGGCNALRKFNNTIFAFQDRCISEILFNSRTQLSTTSGVPVEIANSGKVDGKRIVTNNYGCINKWSIVEGKRALYFIDNINKAFCSFDGTALDNISSRNGFEALFRNTNSTQKWNPFSWDNVVSFYDKENSDVYLMDEYETFSPNGETGCLVYSETLGNFSSFFGYSDAPMMANVNSDFIAFCKNGSGVNKLWWQNKGTYCNFFGTQENFFVSYNVMPEPYGDKIWTNLEYRADFFKDLDANNESTTVEQIFNGGEYYSPHVASNYLEAETFDTIYAWNEYQRTPNFTADASTKKFRIWRTVIPRAEKTETNKYSLDRIRNPWMRLFFGKSITGNQNKNLAQLHDINVIYYE